MQVNEDPVEHGVDWLGSDPLVVPITTWEPQDSLEDRVKQAQLDGTGLQSVIDSMVEELAETKRSQAISWFLTEVINHRRPKLRAVQIGIAAGCKCVNELTGPEWAKRFRISKQAMQQAVQAIRRKWKLRPTRTMRSAQAIRNLKASYAERAKGKA